MMNILVSNDDGVYAPGLHVLVEALSTLASVVVMAPDRNRSGVSNALTLSQPVRVKQLENHYYSVEGTPTDCVHLALTGFLDIEFDMVVAGINDGANLGDDVLYSGTVAAAMEGRYLGLPAIAVSLTSMQDQHYATAAAVTKMLVQKLAHQPLPKACILNVNVPDIPAAQLQGIQVTRLGKRHHAEPTVRSRDPRGKEIFWMGPPGPEADAGIGTDFHAIANGYASMTPLHLDMTHYRIFDEVAAWTEDMIWTY